MYSVWVYCVLLLLGMDRFNRIIELVEAGRCIYLSLNWFIIGSDSVLSPFWYQAITWTNAGCEEQALGKNQIHSFTENVFANFVWEMVAILCRSQCAKTVSLALRRWHYCLYTIKANMIKMDTYIASIYLNWSDAKILTKQRVARTGTDTDYLQHCV